MAEEEEDGGGGEGLSLDAREIKKFFKMADNGKRTLNFAFVPAAGQDDPLFTIHRRKKPDNLGKAAKNEAEQTKFACGTMTVDGKTVVLACDRLVPGLDKKLKKMLRQMKVQFDVRLTDPEGNEIT